MKPTEKFYKIFQTLFFMIIEAAPNPVFLLHATLMIPAVTVKPSLDDVQEALTSVGKTITGVAKGVAQWNSRGSKVIKRLCCIIFQSCPICALSNFVIRACGKICLIHPNEIWPMSYCVLKVLPRSRSRKNQKIQKPEDEDFTKFSLRRGRYFQFRRKISIRWLWTIKKSLNCSAC